MTTPASPWVLTLDRELRAARERIFEALSTPALLTRWWGPAGFALPEIELDLRVGGSYRFGMQPPEGELFHLAGEFTGVEPPERLAYTFRWEPPDEDDRETLADITLTTAGDGTMFSLRQGGFATEARLELHRQGWSESLDKLRELVEAGA